MYRIFMIIRAWLSALVDQPPRPDPLDALSPRELADLPPMHPACDPEPC